MSKKDKDLEITVSVHTTLTVDREVLKKALKDYAGELDDDGEPSISFMDFDHVLSELMEDKKAKLDTDIKHGDITVVVDGDTYAADIHDEAVDVDVYIQAIAGERIDGKIIHASQYCATIAPPSKRELRDMEYRA